MSHTHAHRSAMQFVLLSFSFLRRNFYRFTNCLLCLNLRHSNNFFIKGQEERQRTKDYKLTCMNRFSKIFLKISTARTTESRTSNSIY